MTEPIYCSCFDCTSHRCNSCRRYYYSCTCLPQYKKRVDNVSGCCVCDQEVNENIDGWVDIHEKRTSIPAGFIHNCSYWCLFKIHYSCIYRLYKGNNRILNDVSKYIDKGICISHYVFMTNNLKYFYKSIHIKSILHYIGFILCYNSILNNESCMYINSHQFINHYESFGKQFEDIKINSVNEIIQYLPSEWSNEFINYIVYKVDNYIISVKNIKQIIIARIFKAFKLKIEIKRRIEMRKGAQLFKPIFDIVMNEINYQPGNPGFIATENHWNNNFYF